jgi:ribonuclease-3
MKFAEIEEKIGYVFKNRKLLEEALTHPSKKLEDKMVKTYQRLEFIGDKTLNFIIAQRLFELFSNEDEGEISRRHANLVAGFVCAKVASNLGILEYVSFSKAQENDETYRKEKVLEDCLEAIIGGILLDSGIENAKKFVLKHWNDFIVKDIVPPKDAKSTLQEYFQKHFKTLPQYEISQSGDMFFVKLNFKSKTFEVTAKTKKEGEKEVAEKVLEYLDKSKNQK